MGLQLQCRAVQKYWNKPQILLESSKHFLGIRKGLNLGLKAWNQLQNKNHTEDWALGCHPRENGHVTY